MAGMRVSVEEYLRTGYRPDCDYLDGNVVERNLGEFDHSSAQREILLSLVWNYPNLRERILPEQRVQVNARRFRIPDVCILAAGAGCQKIITTAPELCIEVLSPEDTLTRTMERVGDYHRSGQSRSVDCYVRASCRSHRRRSAGRGRCDAARRGFGTSGVGPLQSL